MVGVGGDQAVGGRGGDPEPLPLVAPRWDP